MRYFYLKEKTENNDYQGDCFCGNKCKSNEALRAATQHKLRKSQPTLELK